MSLSNSTVVMMCGLPASGKTTAAGRLHERLGGALIRSCDIYQELGIVVSDWVRRTNGFTDLAEYDRLRDQAYLRMAQMADGMLSAGCPLVFIDFAHPDLAKRRVLYDICHKHEATVVVLICCCDDVREVQRRFQARRGREAEPEHEASDLSVFDDINRRWQSPLSDTLSDGTQPTILLNDTFAGIVTPLHVTASAIASRILDALGA